jgi:hypothetical protein
MSDVLAHVQTFMQQSPWDENSYRIINNFRTFMYSTKVHYRVYKTPPLIIPVHTLSLHFNIYFNIILIYMYTFRIFEWLTLYALVISKTCCLSHPLSPLIWSLTSHRIWLRTSRLDVVDKDILPNFNQLRFDIVTALLSIQLLFYIIYDTRDIYVLRLYITLFWRLPEDVDPSWSM